MAIEIELRIEEGVDAPRSICLQSGASIIVGRGTESDTMLDDPVMSRKHFSLSENRAKFFVEDLGSSTGTYLNGQRIATLVEVNRNDELIAGNTKFLIHVQGGSDAETLIPAKTKVWAELSDFVGKELGGYALGQVIGVGQTGLIFEAFHQEKKRKAAVKVFSKAYTRNADQRERFTRGMQVFCKIRDPHFVRMYQAGKSAKRCYVAMEMIEGENVADLIERIGIDGKLNWAEVWRCARHVASALVAAYDHEVIHRNLVPGNILRREHDKSYLLGDFTLAKPLGPADIEVTKVDDVIGEVHYLSPERIKDAAATDTRSDIYGLGATCYAMLTGGPPAKGNGLSEIIACIQNQEPDLPSNSQIGINDHFESVVMKMISKQPAKRFQTPHQLIKELDRIGKFAGLTAT